MGFFLTGLLLLAIASSSLAQQCNETVIVNALSVDPICTTAYSRVTGRVSSLTRFTQDELNLEAIYLCGDHCGMYFFEAAEAACPSEDVTYDFTQLHCACTPTRCSPSVISPNTTYCAYTEILNDLSGYLATCGNSTTSCTDNCASLLQGLVNSAGCCLREQYSSDIVSSVGYLHDGDSTFAVFGDEDLYAACGVDYPDRCEAASGALPVGKIAVVHVLLLVFAAVAFTF